MKNVLEVVKQLQADSSRTGKEEILKQNQDNEELKEVLRFINDSFNLTGMTSKIMKKFIGKQFGVKLPVFETIFDVMKYVSVNNSSKHTDVLAVVNFIEKEEDEELKDLYYKIISKELKTGAARTMLNKVYGKDFVPKFEVLLAKKFEDHQHKVEGKEFVITEKLDGLRCILVVEDDSVKMFSRQGKPMQGFVEIEEYAQYLPNAVYDGEMLISNADNYTDRDVLQETMKVARKDGNKTGLTLHLFDMLPVDEFKDGKSKENFIARKEKLIDELHELRSPVITYVPNLYEGKDMSKIPGI
ncbi:MAG: ATP-dependent DNA ligase, partial [Candidatus Paceibacterota bacterium]